MKPGAIRMILGKLLGSFYGTDKFMALSVLCLIPPDTPGEHLKTGNTNRHTGGIKTRLNLILRIQADFLSLARPLPPIPV